MVTASRAESEDAVSQLVRDAEAIESAGAYALVLEGVTTGTSHAVTSRVGIPTIGIGAGIHCDGQVQVLHDMYSASTPTSSRSTPAGTLNLHVSRPRLSSQYVADVQSGDFPTENESFN